MPGRFALPGALACVVCCFFVWLLFVGFFLLGKFDFNLSQIPVVDRPCLALVRQCRKKKSQATLDIGLLHVLYGGKGTAPGCALGKSPIRNQGLLMAMLWMALNALYLVWPQRDGQSFALRNTSTADTLVLDPSFFRPCSISTTPSRLHHKSASAGML